MIMSCPCSRMCAISSCVMVPPFVETVVVSLMRSNRATDLEKTRSVLMIEQTGLSSADFSGRRRAAVFQPALVFLLPAMISEILSSNAALAVACVLISHRFGRPR